MEKEEFLNEEKYKKNNKKIKKVGTVIMLIGLCMIIFAIITLISASKMDQQIENASQTSQDIVGGMFEIDSSEGASKWFETSTKSMSNQSQMRREQMKKQATGMFLLIPGIFVTVVGAMIRFFVGNHREIMAYQIQQVMPVAQEGIEKVAPTIGKVGRTISEEMAPAYGKIAQEISKGIKTGMGDTTKIYCKYCGGEIDSDSNFCPKCGKQIK